MTQVSFTLGAKGFGVSFRLSIGDYFQSVRGGNDTALASEETKIRDTQKGGQGCPHTKLAPLSFNTVPRAENSWPSLPYLAQL